MGDIVDTLEKRIQNGNLTAIEKIITPRFELRVRSINVCFGWDFASVTANSEPRDHTEITALSENVFARSNPFLELNAKDETRGNIPDKVS